ncbi:MAG: amidohydrolase [Candidatus Parabeggiatoa sp. nov. 3]|nr:MAG: amidohydrolase [Gammaproteobacteria bacterium]RKZ68448.1 MAG: amidohydrolase [Gammaproteobacteria bacterium]RKZ87002.1 MAG: amidohydrolase [Gammaproteobacteria bacterium]HEW98538.1 amidohydrolase [Beggiatoa sp.]
MLNNYQIIDADCHVLEPFDMWKKYVDPAFKDRAPSLEQTLNGEKITNKLSDQVQAQGVEKVKRHHLMAAMRGFNANSQVTAIKKLGVDIAFLYPTDALFVLAIDSMDTQLAGALTRAYNNWLRDFCSSNTQVLRGVGAINLHDPNDMVPELHRITKWGWKAVFMRPNPLKGRLLSDPAYEPFWNECERLGIAIGIHEATHGRLPTTGADRFNTRFGMHACSHPMEQMMAMLALIEGGVLERHPKLRVAFLEAGCGWLPYWLWRLDREYQELGWEVKENVKMKPSDYFRRQCFIGIEPAEPYLPEIINYVGTDNLILGSDYPHIDHDQHIINDAVKLEDRLSKKTVQKILWDNPIRFYGLS